MRTIFRVSDQAPSTLDVKLPPSAIVGAPWVRKSDLEPRTADGWASRLAATGFLSGADRRALLAITSDTAGAPNAANDVAATENGSNWTVPLSEGTTYTFLIGSTLSANRNPKDSFGPYKAARLAPYYPSGKVLYLQSPNGHHCTLALSAAATLVGAGSGAYLYFAATVSDKTGDIGRTTDEKDWWLLSDEQPSDLDIALPARDIIDGDTRWLKANGSNATTLAAAFVQKLITAIEATTGTWLKRLRKIIQGNNETETLKVTRVAATPSNSGEIYILHPQNGQALLYPPAATKAGTPFSVSDLREFKAGDFLTWGGVEWEIGDTPWNVFQGNVLQANVVLADGYTYDAADVPALNAAADLVLEGRDIHLGLIIPAILKRAAANIGGKGGAAGKVWSYLSSNANATWRRLLDVLKLDADTAAKRADYQAALATGRLQKSVAGNSDVTLTDAEAAYDSIEFTGAKTGDVVVTLPAKPTGPRLLRNQSTGVFDLNVKATGQSDAAALTLDSGANLILHEGGTLAWLPPMRGLTSEITVTGNNATLLAGCVDADWITVMVWEAPTANPGPNDKCVTSTVRFGSLTTSGLGFLVETPNGNQQFILIRGSGSDAGKLLIRKGGGLSDPVKAIAAFQR